MFSYVDLTKDLCYTGIGQVTGCKAVLAMNRPQLSKREGAALETLVVYWENVTELIERQEDGASKEGKPLFWEDSRRSSF